MENKKVIIYDFDGVILNSIPAAKANAMQAHPSMTEEQYQSLFHKKPYMDGLETVEHLRKIESEEEYKERRRKFSIEKANSNLFDGTLDTLKTLSDKYFLTINTNAIEENFIPIMEKHDLVPYFLHIAFREDDSSKMIRNKKIIKQFNTSPEDAIYITDSTGDVVEAHEAGIASIGVTWGVHDREYFEDVADMNLFGIVDTQAELIEKINSFFSK